MAELGVGRDDSVPKRLDHFRFDVVRQMPSSLRCWHSPPAVFDFFLLGQRIVHPGKDFDVLREHARELSRGSFALAAVLFCQVIQGRFQTVGLTVDRELQPSDVFIKKTVPSRRTHGRLIVQKLLQLVRELIGPHGAQAVEDRFEPGQFRVLAKESVQLIIWYPVDLKREKDKRRGECGHLVLCVSHGFGPLRIGGVLVVSEAHKGH